MTQGFAVRLRPISATDLFSTGPAVGQLFPNVFAPLAPAASTAHTEEREGHPSRSHISRSVTRG